MEEIGELALQSQGLFPKIKETRKLSYFKLFWALKNTSIWNLPQLKNYSSFLKN